MKVNQLKRREFIKLLGGTAAAWPLAARAQQTGNPARIGIVALGSASNPYDASLVEAFRGGIRQVGRDEASIDAVWIKNESEYTQAISDLLQRGASILVTAGTTASLAAKRQTSTIPIVFVSVGDPIGVGLVENLSHPVGNVTGFSIMTFDLTSKYVGMARELDLTAVSGRRSACGCNYYRNHYRTFPNFEEMYNQISRLCERGAFPLDRTIAGPGPAAQASQSMRTRA